MVKSACGIEAVYMCFNGTGIWGGETMYEEKRWLKIGQISAQVIGPSDHVVYLGVPKTQVASNRPTECRPDNC